MHMCCQTSFVKFYMTTSIGLVNTRDLSQIQPSVASHQLVAPIQTILYSTVQEPLSHSLLKWMQVGISCISATLGLFY